MNLFNCSDLLRTFTDIRLKYAVTLCDYFNLSQPLLLANQTQIERLVFTKHKT